MKIKIKYILQVAESFLYGWTNRLLGKKIKIATVSFISRKASLITDGAASFINIGFRSAVRNNTELHADGGIIYIGEKCFINKNCMIVSHERIDIQSGVTIGPNVCIYDHDHDGNGGFISKPIMIKANTWIGAGCIILKGVTIGENCTVAAGTVVSKDVPDNMLVYQHRDTLYRAKEIL